YVYFIAGLQAFAGPGIGTQDVRAFHFHSPVLDTIGASNVNEHMSVGVAPVDCRYASGERRGSFGIELGLDWMMRCGDACTEQQCAARQRARKSSDGLA